ncbi:MAG: hypothetical protein RIS70_3426 [Planctomycetota bacterium]|jgi:sulfite exporter TauE/SafE
MIELGLLLISGMLGSSHCLGMCGGFVLALARPGRSWGHNFFRQSCYTLGRVSTYAFLGAVAGWAGNRFVAIQQVGTQGAGVLAVLAGLLLCCQGLMAVGWWPRLLRADLKGGCSWLSILRPVLAGQNARDVFVAGVFTGFIPCGLVYSMLALAASSHGVVAGLTKMIAFGLGTAPALVLVGTSGVAVPHWLRLRLWRIAAWCLVLAGAITMTRGAYAVTHPPSKSCPFCDAVASDRS